MLTNGVSELLVRPRTFIFRFDSVEQLRVRDRFSDRLDSPRRLDRQLPSRNTGRKRGDRAGSEARLVLGPGERLMPVVDAYHRNAIMNGAD